MKNKKPKIEICTYCRKEDFKDNMYHFDDLKGKPFCSIVCALTYQSKKEEEE